MMYIEGFVAAVPTKNREVYKQHVEAAAQVFKDYGALKMVECWGGGCSGWKSDLLSHGG
jgi:uncharacterized protein YbaA (DUF1428 family)